MGNFRPGIGYGGPVIAVFAWNVVMWVLAVLFCDVVHAARVVRERRGACVCNIYIRSVQYRGF